MWTFPSAVSREGATVAAFAAHMADALLATRRKSPPAVAAASAIIASSDPRKPRRRSVRRLGRSCGGRTACTTPRSRTKRIFESPSSAAARGFDSWLPSVALATLPGDRPP